jgi:uncharacterized membrane protein
LRKNTPVPKENKQNTNRQPDRNGVVKVAQAESFSGPLPHPDILSRYDSVHPGAAKIILDAFQNQGQHRQQLESIVVRQGSRDSLLGLIFAFIIGMTVICGGIYCINNGHEISGAIVSGSGLTGLVGTFIYGSRERRQERESRAQAIIDAG